MVMKQILFLACIALQLVLTESSGDLDEGCTELAPKRAADGKCKPENEESEMAIPNFCHDSANNYQCNENTCTSSYEECRSLKINKDKKDRTACTTPK